MFFTLKLIVICLSYFIELLSVSCTKNGDHGALGISDVLFSECCL